MNHEQMMKQGRQTAVKMLWGMAGSAGPIEMPADQRATMAANLRHMATLLEQAPEHVAGMVFISGERVMGDQEGVAVSCNIVGTSPAVAACHLIIEEVGEQAMQEVLPELMVEALVGVLGTEMAESLKM